MRQITAFLSLAWSAFAVAQTGLEFLDPKDIAYVEVKGAVRELINVPISGANVLAIWEGTTYGFHSSNRHCLRIDATRTRPDGSFSLVTPAKSVYRSGMAQQYVDIRIYRTGMEERFEPGAIDRKMKLVEDKRSSFSKLIGPKELGLDLNVRMIASKEDVPDRLRTLKKLADPPIACETKGDVSEIQSYFESIASEARSLAKTRYQRAVAEELESNARMLFSDTMERWNASSKIMEQAYAAPESSDLERRDRADMTPLMQAADSGNADTVRALLAAGANPNRTRAINDLTGGDSALTIAMSRYLNDHTNKLTSAAKYPPVIQALLIDPRTDSNLRDRPIDYTPLMKALNNSQDDVVEWLLAAGANPNLTAYGGRYSALGIALDAMQTTKYGKPLPAAVRQFELLLASKRVDLDFVIRYEGRTALIQSLVHGEHDTARRLLEAGANPNAVDGLNRTPLIASTEAAILNPHRPKFVDGLRLIAAWPGVDYEVLYHGKSAIQMARDAERADLISVLEKK
jgi:ankyrin repeat protein